jgi:hypothetical protein
MSTFKVVTRIWHTKDNKYYEPGDVVDLSHLDGFGIAALLEAGAVEPILPERKRKTEAPPQEGEK